jgi:phenylacetate-CoA ligase
MNLIDIAWMPIVALINGLQTLFLRHQGVYKFLLVNQLEGFRWHVSKHRAARLADKAIRGVPAYADYYKDLEGKRITSSNFNLIPATDKESYVKKYRLEDRVWGGKLPSRGVTVDESSGSTGSPTNWVRGWDERMNTKELLQLSFHSTFGKGEIFAFNAFVLGAWATGMIVSQSLGEVCIMKSTGSDAQKILDTMKYFGKGYNYVIMGYPPFLKSLIDDNEFNWTGYNVDAIYGGEAITEQLRDYLSQTFGKVIGSYGASDLEVNIGYENDLTIAVRKALLEDPNLRKELVKDFGSLPSVFQYNPLGYYVETNEDNELLFTINRTANITPKVRYNIHDIGYKMRYKEVEKALIRAGRMDIIENIKKDGKRVLNLPFLFHYGRSDMSINYFGAKVTPEGIRQALNAIPELSPHLQSFQGFNAENKHKDTLMVICVELARGAPVDTFNAKDLANQFSEELGKLNGDFYKMLSTAKEHLRPEIRLYEHETGPFAGGHKKIKHSYVATAIQYDDIPS